MEKGELVPDFTLPMQDGSSWTLSEKLKDGPVVLFFYPAAMTFGCTREACSFRDMGAEYKAAGVQRVGISFDSVDKQKAFAEKDNLDYPLLSDVGGTVAKTFGAARASAAKRMTFVIGTDQKLREMYKSEVRFAVHADKALAALTTS